MMLHFRTQMIYMTGLCDELDPPYEGLQYSTGYFFGLEEISKTQSRHMPSWELTYSFPKHY